MQQKEQTVKRPKSRAHWSDPLVIAVILIASYGAFSRLPWSNLLLVVAMVASVLAVMVPLEISRAPWRRVPRPDVPLASVLKEAGVKWLGVMLGLSLVLLGWSLVNEYAFKAYRPFIHAIGVLLPYMPVVTAMWIFVTEWRLGPAHDHTWHFGRFVLGRWDEIDWSIVRTGLFGWLIRGFFLPLNVVAAYAKIGRVRGHEMDVLTGSWPQIVAMLDHMITGMLLVAIIPGYMFASRLLGTEIRKVGQSAFAWVVTLLCYPPANRATGAAWFHFRLKSETLVWVTVFGAYGGLSIAVGLLLVVCYLVHYWGEAIFCLRSSHLTNRGIITNGPFRYTKHPVYVSKCVAWGLTFLPFTQGADMRETVSLTLAYVAFCGIYVLRGWVEERLLSEDARYVAYARWMDRHGALAWLGRKVPVLSFAWRYRHWHAKGLCGT